MDTLKRAEILLKEGNVSPHIAVEIRSELSGEYSFNCGILEDILTRKPGEWNKIRAMVSSDKQADKIWDATKDGIDETVLRIRLKRIERLISAFSMILRLAEGQSNNQY